MEADFSFPRYDSYKDSGVDWLGEIPAHWSIKRFKFTAKTTKGKLPKRIVHFGSKDLPPYLTMEYLRGGDPDQRVADKNAIPISEGKVLLLWDGSNAGEFLKSKFGVVSSTLAHVIFTKKLNSQYAWYYTKFLEQQLKNQTIGMGIPHVAGKTLNNLLFCWPLSQEQNRIANFLDQKTAEIDTAIAKKQRLIELLKEQKAILINQAVTRGLNPDAPMHDSGVEWIGEIPAHWQVKKLKYYSKVQSGITLGKLYSGNKLNTVPYLRVANVQDGYFKLDDIAELQLPSNIIKKYLIRKGDILVTEGGDIDKLGRGSVWTGEIENCIHQNHIFVIRIKQNIASEYFVSLAMGVDYGRRYFTQTANKTTNLASTNRTKLGNFPIALPPISEQKLISTYVNDIHSKYNYVVKTAHKEMLCLSEFKQIVVSNAVTGKIKI